VCVCVCVCVSVCVCLCVGVCGLGGGGGSTMTKSFLHSVYEFSHNLIELVFVPDEVIAGPRHP